MANPMVFPAQGQTKEQQEQDQFSCHKWAVENTGVDPMNMRSGAPPSQESAMGGAVRGGARGAALLCRNRRSVNPWHMEIVTGKVNTLRGVGASAMNARKTMCFMGHPFAGSNLIIRGASRQGVADCC